MNTGKNTRYNISNGLGSAIYLTLYSSSINHLLSWDVSESTHQSDHHPQIIKIENCAHTNITRYQTWIIKKVNGKNLKMNWILQITLRAKKSKRWIIKSQLIYYKSQKKRIPKTKTTIRKRNLLWWNEQCSKAIKIKNRALTRNKRQLKTENVILFKKARANARKVIREARENSWQNFITLINCNTPTSEFWKKIKQISMRRTLSQIKALKDKQCNIITEQ